jgi:hypothetical protein
MGKRLAVIAVFFLVAALGGLGTAQAKPDAGKANHGQCVSSSAQPEGKGGRSEIAHEKGACTPQLACVENGDVELDSARNEVAVTDADPSGSSLQCEAEIAVQEGDLLTFDYVIENGSCGGGIPRIYIVIDGDFYNTFDTNPGRCGAGEDFGSTSGSVTYEIEATGTVTEIGFVSDRRDGEYSTVIYSNAQIDGVTLNI